MKTNRTLILAACILLMAGCSARTEGGSSFSASPPAASSDGPETSGTSEQSLPAEQSIRLPERSPLEQAVLSAVLEENRGKYLPGEFQGAGCQMVETFPEGEELRVYAWTEYIEYAFQDGQFVNISGTRAKAFLRFEVQEERYTLKEYLVLDPTSGLTDEQLEKLIAPIKETGKDYLYTEEDLAALRQQVDDSARRYLQSIGREAAVCERSGHEENSLFSLGVNEEVYYQITENEAAKAYPDWTGSCETVEDGVRYVYTTRYDQNMRTIRYEKTRYDTGEATEALAFDAVTGKPLP